MTVRTQWMTVGAVAALGVSGAVSSSVMALNDTGTRDAGAASAAGAPLATTPSSDGFAG